MRDCAYASFPHATAPSPAPNPLTPTPHFDYHISMLFTFICTDKPDSLQIRKDARPAHLEHLDAHADQLVYGGPLFGADNETPIGSLIIADVEDREAAEKFAAEDPYNQAGLFASVVINGTRQVYPKG